MGTSKKGRIICRHPRQTVGTGFPVMCVGSVGQPPLSTPISMSGWIESNSNISLRFPLSKVEILSTEIRIWACNALPEWIMIQNVFVASPTINSLNMATEQAQSQLPGLLIVQGFLLSYFLITTLYYMISYCCYSHTILRYITLHYITLHYITLHYIEPCHVVLPHIIS